MTRIIKGNFIFTKEKDSFETYENSYITIEDGFIKSIRSTLPENIIESEIEDFGDKFIIPGFVDLHLHASQWPNLGKGYDKQLIPWLNEYTFPLESSYQDIGFAKQNYSKFISDLKSVGTTRAVIFATRHLEATRILIDLLKKSGIGAYVGKVNMDRNAPNPLVENTENSIQETIALIQEELQAIASNADPLVKPILTPRFVPCTTSALMKQLGELAKEYHLPIQSHLDENLDEIAWVKELHPELPSFTHVYEAFDLLVPYKTIMAHCIYCNEDEIALLKDKHIYIAHCAASNCNISSGMMPLRNYLDQDMLIGLGSDISGGHTLDMRQNIVLTIQVSKLYALSHPECKPVSMSEAFYLATKGGGRFFGKVGSFEEGYEFDALVIDDTCKKGSPDEPLTSRLEKFICSGNPTEISKTFVRGNEI